MAAMELPELRLLVRDVVVKVLPGAARISMDFHVFETSLALIGLENLVNRCKKCKGSQVVFA